LVNCWHQEGEGGLCERRRFTAKRTGRESRTFTEPVLSKHASANAAFRIAQPLAGKMSKNPDAWAAPRGPENLRHETGRIELNVALPERGDHPLTPAL
jgi:hypothetical protein